MKRLYGLMVCVLLVLLAVPALAQERPYKDGPVTIVTSVKLVDGQFENYMAYLDANWRRVMEESKKAGLVTEYHVYGTQAHNPNEPDLYLVVTYPNMATFDGLDAKMDPISEKVTKMNFKQADEASGKRTVMRNIMGEMMVREMLFK
jgi:competence protein ComGC